MFSTLKCTLERPKVSVYLLRLTVGISTAYHATFYRMAIFYGRALEGKQFTIKGGIMHTVERSLNMESASCSPTKPNLSGKR